MIISFPTLGKFSTIVFSNSFSDPFSFFSSFGIPIIQILMCLVLSQRSLIQFSFLCILFSLFCSMTVISTILSSNSLFHSFLCLTYQLLIPSIIFFISVIVLFITVFLFFSYSRSLLNISYIYTICASIVFPRYEVIFTIISLNSFSGRLSTSSLFS